MTRLMRDGCIIGLVLLMVGCQTWPDDYVAGVDRLTIRQKVRNARAQRIDGWPGLRVDSAAQKRLDEAMCTDDPTLARRDADAFLVQSHVLARETAPGEILRLNDEAINALCARYFPDAATTREQLIAAYLAGSDATLAAARRRTTDARDAQTLRRVLRQINDGIESPVKHQGKTGRIMAWLPFYLPARMAADHVRKSGAGCPLFLGGFNAAEIYAPPDAQASALERYAPMLVVERAADPVYAPDADRIGQVIATDMDHVEVRPDQPTLYSYARRVWLMGHEHEQLVYVAWFPEHPALTANDPMAGRIDGLTVRITLDREGRPAVVETMANCGCFHGLYPTQRLEAAAVAEYGEPAEGVRYALAREAGRRLNAHIPSLLADNHPNNRPVVYVAAGWHAIMHVSFEPAEASERETYSLRPYADLELLPTPDGGYTSMFYDNGLVRHAQRPEGVYFTPLGMLSAGQPRQRETQLIYWDRYDFDAPDLLAQLLNLPAAF